MSNLEKLNSFLHLFLVALCFVFLTGSNWPEKSLTKREINNYTPIFLPLYDSCNQLRIAIRSYDQASIQYFLLVDPYTLKMHVETIAKTKPISSSNKTNTDLIFSALTCTPHIVLPLFKNITCLPINYTITEQ